MAAVSQKGTPVKASEKYMFSFNQSGHIRQDCPLLTPNAVDKAKSSVKLVGEIRGCIGRRTELL